MQQMSPHAGATCISFPLAATPAFCVTSVSAPPREIKPPPEEME